MFAYCLNNPVCRKDIGGAVSQCIYDSEFDPTDDDNDLGHGYKGDSRSSNSPQHGQTTTPGNRGATSNAGSTQNNSTNLSSTNANSSSVPQNAYDVRDFVSNHNGSPPNGYKGGKTFANDGRNGSARLPERYAPYLEYDARPKFVGQSRGLERIVIGNGVAYYTPDHYMSFILME
jgi:guanyl-specific ribonuclease Sa